MFEFTVDADICGFQVSEGSPQQSFLLAQTKTLNQVRNVFESIATPAHRVLEALLG